MFTLMHNQLLEVTFNMNQAHQLSTMIALVANKFDGKFDKGGQPYILHCMKVMHYVKSTDFEVLQMCVGHDLIEDCKDVTYEMLKQLGFSDRVIAGIRAVTKVPGQTHKEYMDGIKANPDAILVKLADLRHNSDIRRLKGITEKDVARMRKYHEMYLELKDLV